ncbi:hypothetical protein GCM10010502_08770 [Kitasatospora aureofaciens]|uniref:Uncharacterized protein n=1 Tax=Kitasatospora aureofaciens TaxID=1894 RepID=A0A8H9HFR9_KITAU|nr:hypothetical protein GCM10010502_08770 [Kitasatospora aureofaciens]
MQRPGHRQRRRHRTPDDPHRTSHRPNPLRSRSPHATSTYTRSRRAAAIRWVGRTEPYTDPRPDEAVAFVLRLATGGYDDAVALAAKDLKSLLGR